MVTYSQHQWISFLRPNARALSLISSGDGGLTVFDGNTMYERCPLSPNVIHYSLGFFRHVPRAKFNTGIGYFVVENKPLLVFG